MLQPTADGDIVSTKFLLHGEKLLSGETAGTIGTDGMMTPTKISPEDTHRDRPLETGKVKFYIRNACRLNINMITLRSFIKVKSVYHPYYQALLRMC